MPEYVVKKGDKELARSSRTVEADNNPYFPIEDVKKELFNDSLTHTVCPWKGTASYWNLGEEQDVAWYYPNTVTDRAKDLEGKIAFYKSKVTITEE